MPLIDLNLMSKALYEALGPEKSWLLFKSSDGTHHSNFGSYQLAKCIIEGIKAYDLGLATNLVRVLPQFDPSRPDPFESFKIPASPQTTELKPPVN